MKRYKTVKFVDAEQWTDVSAPVKGMIYFADEVIEHTLGEIVKPLYCVPVGEEKRMEPIFFGDWVLCSNDQVYKVMSNKQFRECYEEA